MIMAKTPRATSRRMEPSHSSAVRFVVEEMKAGEWRECESYEEREAMQAVRAIRTFNAALAPHQRRLVRVVGPGTEEESRAVVRLTPGYE